MPSNKSLIKSYREADISSGTCAAYSPLNHFAYCGNRKGEVNIYDVRIHKKLQKFVASESSVKALDLDAEEYYIATGSSEGNVKVRGEGGKLNMNLYMKNYFLLCFQPSRFGI